MSMDCCLVHLSEKTKILLLNIFISCGIKDCRINARGDFILNGKKVDVQCSTNFERFYDCRVDFMAAFLPKNPVMDEYFEYNEELGHIGNFEHKFQCQVQKPGKIFYTTSYPLFCVVFFNAQFAEVPNFILMIKTADLQKYIFDNYKQMLELVKFPNKEHLKDTYGSAFLPLNVVNLHKQTNCFFSKYPFNDNIEKLKKYLED